MRDRIVAMSRFGNQLVAMSECDALPSPWLEIARIQLGTTKQRQRAEDAKVECGNGGGAQPFRGGCDHTVNKPELKRGVLGAQLGCTLQVAILTPFDRERAVRQIIHERCRHRIAEIFHNEVVDLWKNRPRDNPRGRISLEQLGNLGVMPVITVDQGNDGASVRDNHSSRPIPSSSDSARVDRSPRPLLPAPILEASTGAACRRAYSDTASRTNAAVGRPCALASALRRR